MSFKYESIEELVSYAKEAEGQYLVEIDTKDIINKTNKGSVGAVIEQSFFGYSANSKAEADFADVGIELKTTGVVRQKRGTIAAKERLVLNIINYMDEVNRDFLTSSFWSKNNKLLIFFYTYIRNNDGKPDYNKFQILKT
ncbi:MAG TPA: MutH/Sau3AI family endonuclease, partial [Virgibacillus sp.]